MHYGGNSPAPLGELGVAVSPKGTVYVAGGVAVVCSCSAAACCKFLALVAAELSFTYGVCNIMNCCLLLLPPLLLAYMEP